MNRDDQVPPDGENAPSPLPWERQARESATAFAAFCRYRDLGPGRTLDEVTRQLYPTPAPNQRRTSASRRRCGQVSDWSRAYDWRRRAAAWDCEVDRQTRLAHIEAVRQMGIRHAQIARAVQERALAALSQLSPTDMAAIEILRFLTESAKLERLALGEPTDRTAQEISGGTPVVIEVVERIVPARGDDRAHPADEPEDDQPAVTHRLVGVASEEADLTNWELPDQPPEYMRSAA